MLYSKCCVYSCCYYGREWHCSWLCFPRAVTVGTVCGQGVNASLHLKPDHSQILLHTLTHCEECKVLLCRTDWVSGRGAMLWTEGSTSGRLHASVLEHSTHHTHLWDLIHTHTPPHSLGCQLCPQQRVSFLQSMLEEEVPAYETSFWAGALQSDSPLPINRNSKGKFHVKTSD